MKVITRLSCPKHASPSARCALPLAEQHLRRVRWQVHGPKMEVRRALALLGGLNVVVEHQVRHHRF